MSHSSTRSSTNWVSPSVIERLGKQHLRRAYESVMVLLVLVVLTAYLVCTSQVWGPMVLPLVVFSARLIIAIADYREVRRMIERRGYQQRLTEEFNRYE